jgi:hypothetical protein
MTDTPAELPECPERAEFEKAFAAWDGSRDGLERDGEDNASGDYSFARARGAWWGWQAARRAPIPEAAEIVKRLRRSYATASNDDTSTPMTEKRFRHVARLAAIEDAADLLETLTGVRK